MGIFTLPILGAVGSAIGGIFQNKENRKAEQQQYSDNWEAAMRDRKWYKDDRHNERKYNSAITRKDRLYAEQQRENEREYAKGVLVDERLYSNQQLQKDRQYLDLKRDEDIGQYSKDRDFMQSRSNTLAERSAASRGIDFQRLRDDAVAAGYNPMTALSMAHAYSTNVDYQLQGGVYSPGANYTAVGGGSGGGGGGAAPGAVMGSHVPAAGSFSGGGGGYQSQYAPALSAGTFIADAMDRSIDAWTNRPVQKDPLADALRNAFQQDQMAQEVRDSQIPKGFGYDLTKQQAFQPEATAGVPALASGKAAPTRMPTGQMEVGGRKYIPVTKPNGKPGRLEASVAARLDINPFDTVSPGDWAEIVGEVGEAESLIDQPAIRRNIIDEWHIGTRIPDYLKSGVTGSRQFPKGQHFNPWMQ